MVLPLLPVLFQTPFRKIQLKKMRSRREHHFPTHRTESYSKVKQVLALVARFLFMLNEVHTQVHTLYSSSILSTYCAPDSRRFIFNLKIVFSPIFPWRLLGRSGQDLYAR